MPTKRPRINLALPPDLQELVQNEAAEMRVPEATRVTQIIDEHFKRIVADTRRNTKVLKGSRLLAGRPEVTMDFSGGLLEAQSRSGEKSKDAKGA